MIISFPTIFWFCTWTQSRDVFVYLTPWSEEVSWQRIIHSSHELIHGGISASCVTLPVEDAWTFFPGFLWVLTQVSFPLADCTLYSFAVINCSHENYCTQSPMSTPSKWLNISGGFMLPDPRFSRLGVQKLVHDLACLFFCSDHYECKCCILSQSWNLNEGDAKQKDTVAKCDETSVLSHWKFGVMNSV